MVNNQNFITTDTCIYEILIDNENAQDFIEIVGIKYYNIKMETN